jgi:cytochrome c oxidase subunit 2
MRTKSIGLVTLPLFALTLSALCAAKPLCASLGEREIRITARRCGFSPKRITVAKGEHVKLVVTSEDEDHGFAIREFGIEQEIKAKQTKVIELTPNKEGRFEFSCSVNCEEGQNNMSGELIVTEPQAGSVQAVKQGHDDIAGEIVVGAREPEAVSKINVTFDQSTPGVVVVESGGERLRINTTTKTIDRISEVTVSQESNKQPAPQVAAKDRESSKAYEPYDYHIVNIPTPKAVRRHSLNMYFTHRFQETITPLEEEGGSQHIARISKDLLGLDSSAVSSFGVTYGITDRLYANVYRSPLCQPGLCKTIELGLGYHLLDEAGRSPIALSAYASVEGDYNFTERYTYNFQAMIGRSITRYVNLFFSPALHVNSNGNDRFKGFLASQPLVMNLRLGRNTGSFGFGVNARVRPTTSLLFEYTPRVGFEMGQIVPDFDTTTGQLTGFKNNSEAEMAFGIEKRIGRHVFSLTFSNTQATTTARYNSSNQALPPNKFSIGFNLFRRLL